MKKNLFLLAMLCFVLGSCEKKLSLAEQTADQLCKCQAAKDYAKLTASLKDKDEETKNAALTEVVNLYTEVATCMGNDLKKKIAALQFSDKDKFEENLNQAITVKCTDVNAKGVLELARLTVKMNN